MVTRQKEILFVVAKESCCHGTMTRNHPDATPFSAYDEFLLAGHP
jgi:hypothetical protein